MVLGSSPVAVTSPSDLVPASSKEFLDIQATIECGFTLKTCMWHDKNIQSLLSVLLLSMLKLPRIIVFLLVLTTLVNCSQSSNTSQSYLSNAFIPLAVDSSNQLILILIFFKQISIHVLSKWFCKSYLLLNFISTIYS